MKILSSFSVICCSGHIRAQTFVCQFLYFLIYILEEEITRKKVMGFLKLVILLFKMFQFILLAILSESIYFTATLPTMSFSIFYHHLYHRRKSKSLFFSIVISFIANDIQKFCFFRLLYLFFFNCL